ncbi:hypothetical protein AJ79_02598 [Helicocarpus griseus UAMH5409]|uniref:Polymerase nucleotidyl transferase domain-containing protein n=1 Tax=Helicocarpus griseus UAMH5409 TaxID=1447875 RepID=A0A2B7Y2G5_9EURO|nr:hypothetical protein AJ79_02598 [Helicocarpus griseus UAMH5409]
MKAATYDLNQYDSDEENPTLPPRENLFAAAILVGHLLSQNGIDYMVMGSFAMICRGTLRNTHDVDIVTSASMKRLLEVVENEPRLKIPSTRLIEDVMKSFVATGPDYGDPGCLENR